MSVIALIAALSLAAPGDTLIRANLGKSMPSKDDKTGPVLSIPFLTTGPLITEDANTVSHVYFDGTQLVDTKGLTWTEGAGGINENTATPFIPTRYASTAVGGTWDGTHIYSTPGTNMVFTGDFTCHVVFRPTTVSSTGRDLFGQNLAVATARFGTWFTSSGIMVGVRYNSGSTLGQATVATAPTVGAYNVFSFGVTGSTLAARLNGGTVATGSVTQPLNGNVTQAISLGYAGYAVGAYTGDILEATCSSTAWDATTVAAIQAKVFGQITSAGTPLTVTRSSAATYDVGGTRWTAPSGALRVNSDGALIEAAATNYALQSATHPKTTEASASVTTGASVAWHAGTGTMTLTAGTATVTGLSCTTVAAGTPCTFTVTVAGTMLITTTSGTTLVQIEKGSVPTSYIATTTTAATRQADSVTFSSPLTPSIAQFCVGLTTKGTYAAGAGLYNFLISAGTYDATDGWYARTTGSVTGSPQWGVEKPYRSAPALTNGQSYTFKFSYPGTGILTDQAIYQDGARVDNASGNVGMSDGIIASQSATIRLNGGSVETTSRALSYKDVKFWNVVCSKAR